MATSTCPSLEKEGTISSGRECCTANRVEQSKGPPLVGKDPPGRNDEREIMHSELCVERVLDGQSPGSERRNGNDQDVVEDVVDAILMISGRKSKFSDAPEAALCIGGNEEALACIVGPRRGENYHKETIKSAMAKWVDALYLSCDALGFCFPAVPWVSISTVPNGVQVRALLADYHF